MTGIHQANLYLGPLDGAVVHQVDASGLPETIYTARSAIGDTQTQPWSREPDVDTPCIYRYWAGTFIFRGYVHF